MKNCIKIVLKFLIKLSIVLLVVFAICFFINKKNEKANSDSTKETVRIIKETKKEIKNELDTKIDKEIETNKKQNEKQKEIVEETIDYVEYKFRTKKLLNDHYKKHGKEMGFKNASSYEKAANKVINNKDALIKEEKEDGDYVYYIVDTNEIVFLSKDGYIRSYFNPTQGKKYFDKQ